MAIERSESIRTYVRIISRRAGRATLALNVSGADSAPAANSVTGSAPSIVKLQLAEAAGAAKQTCQGDSRAKVRTAAARITSLYRHGQRPRARRLLARLLAEIHGSAHGSPSPGPAHGASRGPAAHAASGCSFDGTVHVSLRDVDGVSDDLAAAAAAQAIGDERGADEALAAARQDFAEWVNEGAGGAQSAGDWMSVATAAQWLGSETIADEAMEHARAAAREALDAGEKLGACSMTKDDAPCVMRALMAAILLGAENSEDIETVKGLLEGVAAQGASNALSGCEEWSLSVSIAGSSGPAMTWGPAAFTVNRRAGTIQDAPGVGGGWPGEIPSTTGPCYENGTQVGVGTLSGSAFHFNISGTVKETGFLLELTSSDSHASISVSGPPACQTLGGLGEMFVNAFLQAPFPVYLPLSPGQTSIDTQDGSGEDTFHEVASRISLRARRPGPRP
jgi:hypothetical protein